MSDAINELYQELYEKMLATFLGLAVFFVQEFSLKRITEKELFDIAFSKLWEGKDVKDPESYFKIILHNEAVHQAKEERKHPTIPPDEIPDYDKPREEVEQWSYEEDEYKKWALAHLRKFVELLPEKQKEVIKLHYYEGLKKAQIAKKLKVVNTTVSNRLDAAIEQLRKWFHCLDDNNDTNGTNDTNDNNDNNDNNNDNNGNDNDS